MSERIQLNDQDVEKVVGGAFNWYYDRQGASCCYVDGVGVYRVRATAKDRYSALKIEHKLDYWTDAQYAEALYDEGEFYDYN